MACGALSPIANAPESFACAGRRLKGRGCSRMSPRRGGTQYASSFTRAAARDRDEKARLRLGFAAMSNVRRVIAIVVAVYLLLVFYDRFVLVELFAHRVGVQLVVAAIEAVALIGAGFLTRRMRGDLALNFVIGYPIFGAVCFIVGAINVSSTSMIAVLVIFVLAGAYAIARDVKQRTAGECARHHTGIEYGYAVGAIAILLGCAIVAAQAPPATLDELAYHLAVPWAWVKEHR